MSEFATVLLLIVGELMGDASFFFFGARKHRYPDENYKEKRKQYYASKYSWLMCILTIGTCLLIRELFGEIKTLFPKFTSFWDWVKEVSNLFGRFEIMFVFMFIYRKFREEWKSKLYKGTTAPWEYRDDPKGIYIWNDLKKKYVLSEKWVYIKDGIKYILILNFMLIIVLYVCPIIKMSPGSILTFKIWELVPIAASTCMLEFYNYLSFDNKSFWETGKADTTTEKLLPDLAQLKFEYEKKNFLSLVTPIEIRKHEIQLKDAMRDYMQNCKADSNPFIKYFVSYLEKSRWIKERYYHTGCLETAVHLIKGENLFCTSPFYRDIDICIFFPAFLALLKGKRVLILIEDRGNLEDFVRWVKEGIEDIQSLNDLWRVSILKEGEDDVDVGILSFQDIYRPEDFKWLDGYFEEVAFVAIIEASNILAGGQEAIANLAEKIDRASGKCNWLLCDNNAESMLDLFSHLLHKKFYYVSATPLPAKDIMVGYWDLEQEKEYQWEPVKHYLGTEIQIAEVAWCNDVKKVILYGEEIIPIYDLKWIFGQYYQEFHKRVQREPHQYVMDSGIQMEIVGNACQLTEECFLIVEDSNYNLYETARQYVTRASQKAVIHILSPNYMMRDFMKSNEDSMHADPKYIAQFVPEYINTKRNAAVSIIRKMICQPVSETWIQDELEKCEDWRGEFRGLENIKELIRLIVPLKGDFGEGDIIVSYGSRFDCNESCSVQERYYKIHSENIKRKFARYFQKACYMDENGKKQNINRLILAGHLDQKYLKGQFVVFNGFYYEVLKRRITNYEYILNVRRASEQITGRRYYRQDRRYVLNNIEDCSHTLTECQYEHLCVTQKIADIKVETKGYYTCKGWNEIASSTYTILDKEDVKERNYVSKQFLKIEITIPDRGVAKIVSAQMACLFQESFCTFYPQQYHLLSVALNRGEYKKSVVKEILNGVLSDINLEEPEWGACFYIIEDSMEDMGLIRSIERNFRRIMFLLSEYMQWSRQSGNDYLSFGRSN